MTLFGTVLVGVGIFVISQYFLNLVLEPISRVLRAKADVASTVLFRQRKISNATHHPETAEELRRASSQVRASVSEVCCYSFWSRLGLFGIPTRSDARSACRCLNLMAGNADQDCKERGSLVEMNSKALDELAKFLRIETRY